MTQKTQFMANNTALMSFAPFSHFPTTNFRSACWNNLINWLIAGVFRLELAWHRHRTCPRPPLSKFKGPRTMVQVSDFQAFMFDTSGRVSQTVSQNHAYLIRRNGIYYFSRRVPSDLQTRDVRALPVVISLCFWQRSLPISWNFVSISTY